MAPNQFAVGYSCFELVPFAGIAFLWFIGALRDRLGHLEDRFFATVFLGSALLFLAMFFTAAAIVGALVLAFVARPDELINSDAFHFARAVAYNIMNVYAIKMAAVFMISTSTIVIYAGIAPRWIALLGYTLAVFYCSAATTSPGAFSFCRYGSF